MLSVVALRKRYPSGTLAVDDVTLSVARGEIVGLLGSNGAGKTTIVKCVCGLVTPTAGAIAVNGVDAVRRPRSAVRHVAVALEGNRNHYWRLTPRQNLQIFAGLQGRSWGRVRSEVDDLLERFGLSDRAHLPAYELSRGMQQKLALACALVKGTELLMLDEPTLGLDVESAVELRATLRGMADRGERSILLSTHNMKLVEEVCHRVVILRRGRKVVDEKVAELSQLFRTDTYTVRVGALQAGLAGARGRCWDVLAARGSHGRTDVRVRVSDDLGIYAFLEHLRCQGCVIEGVERGGSDFEEIYLSAIGRGD